MCPIRLISWRACRTAALLGVTLTLGGCAAGTVVPVVGGLGIDIAVFHRDLFDMLVSGLSGRDCSVVRLDRGETYCRPIEPPTPPIPYCTRSLGVVDCWIDPQAMPFIPPEVADGPRMLTPIQNQDRTASWPHLF